MTIFAEALERTDPAARAAYLDGACGDDAALRRRVEALLAAHDGAGRFLEGDSTGTSEPTSPETLEPTAASGTETRLPSELATGVHAIGRHDHHVRGPPRPNVPADPARARSSPAGTRCWKSSAKGGWAPSTGPTRPSRSSVRWR